MGGGTVMSYIGGQKEAKAAGKAAQAQEAEARRARELILTEGRRIESESINPRELSAYEMQLGAAEKQLASDQRLLYSIDPALMEASKQVLSLLRGEQTGVGNAVGAQRAQQRQALLNNLRAQLGPGAETSAAGIRALQQFDSETAMVGANTQNQSLASLFGVINSRPDLMKGAEIAGAAGAGFGAAQTRKTNAGLGMLSALSGANQSVIGSSGSQFVTDQLRGRTTRATGDAWSAASAQFMGSMVGGMTGTGAAGKGKKKATLDEE